MSIFAKDAYPKIITNICRFLCLHDMIINKIVCHAFFRGLRDVKRILEKKFGRIYVWGFIVYVSTDKAIKYKYYHYFVNPGTCISSGRVVTKVDKILRIESLSFINNSPGNWTLNLPTSQGRIKGFKFDSLNPARLDYYMPKLILDSGEGVAIIAYNACAVYIYYDTVDIKSNARVYIKKIIVNDPIQQKKREMTRTITCNFPKNYEGVGKLSVGIVPGSIKNMPAKQLAKMTFVLDHKNSKALMFEKFCPGQLFFLDSRCIDTIDLGVLYKKHRNTRCKNM